MPPLWQTRDLKPCITVPFLLTEEERFTVCSAFRNRRKARHGQGQTQFICQNCARCLAAGSANAMAAASGTPSSSKKTPMGGIGSRPRRQDAEEGRPVALTTLSGEIEEAPRIPTGLAELDRATGGGVRGAARRY